MIFEDISNEIHQVDHNLCEVNHLKPILSPKERFKTLFKKKNSNLYFNFMERKNKSNVKRHNDSFLLKLFLVLNIFILFKCGSLK